MGLVVKDNFASYYPASRYDFGNRSDGFWKNDEYEKLFLVARSTVDKAEREKAYQRMMEIMHAEVPAIFLYGLPSIYGVSDRVKGYASPSDKVLRLYKTEVTAK